MKRLSAKTLLMACVLFAIYTMPACNSCNKSNISKYETDDTALLDFSEIAIDLTVKNSVADFLSEYETNLLKGRGNWSDFKTAVDSEQNESKSFMSLSMLSDYAVTYFGNNISYCDSAFLLLCGLIANLPQQYENIASSICSIDFDEESEFDDRTKTLQDNLSDAGYVPICNEGKLDHLEHSFNFLYSKFYGKTSPCISDFLSERVKYDYNLVEDASLSISYDELWKLILKAEKIKLAYPDKNLNEAISSEIYFWMNILISGLDNSPLYDYYSKKLTNEILEIYKKISESDEPSPMQQIVKEYYHELAKNKFMYNPELIDDTMNKI